MPSTQPRILIVFGTRPEVIKLWPVDRALRSFAGFQVTLCNTGQHRELVPPLLATFGMVPEVELGVMSPGQSLSSLLARLLDGIDPVLDALRFDWVIVQGDTTTALAAALDERKQAALQLQDEQRRAQNEISEVRKAAQEALEGVKSQQSKAVPSWKGGPEFSDKESGFTFKPKGFAQFDAGYVGFPDGDERRVAAAAKLVEVVAVLLTQLPVDGL